MTRGALLAKIRKQARRDEKLRQDPRYLDTLGFLTAKGFLQTNQPVTPLPNKRLWIDHALWAGQELEPRILEVLPAAVLRLRRHFEGLDPVRHAELARVVEQLRRGRKSGDSFCGIPYDKLKLWAEFPLKDKRIRPLDQKKISKTFRLDPDALKRLKKAARRQGTTETEILQNLLLKLS